MRVERIVVGVDGSRNSDRAASVAADLAEITGAAVVAVHAIGLLEEAPGPGEALADRRARIRHDLETAWTALLRRTGIAVTCELRDGDPVDAMVSIADEVDADLLVVGTRGLGRFPEQVLGSTSARLAARTRRPMLLVPDDPVSD